MKLGEGGGRGRVFSSTSGPWENRTTRERERKARTTAQSRNVRSAYEDGSLDRENFPKKGGGGGRGCPREREGGFAGYQPGRFGAAKEHSMWFKEKRN